MPPPHPMVGAVAAAVTMRIDGDVPAQNQHVLYSPSRVVARVPTMKAPPSPSNSLSSDAYTRESSILTDDDESDTDFQSHRGVKRPKFRHSDLDTANSEKRPEKRPVLSKTPTINRFLFENGLLLQVLNYLVGSVDDVDIATKAFPPFRSVNRANELWERLCRSRWKDKFRGSLRLREADAEAKVGAPSDHWYRKYHLAEEDAHRNHITTDELCSLVFSYRKWFITHPSNHLTVQDARPGVLRSGLYFSESDSIRFTVQPSDQNNSSAIIGYMTGHPVGAMSWFWKKTAARKQGMIIRSEGEPTDDECAFFVCRLPNWGWEIRSNCAVMRAIDADGATTARGAAVGGIGSAADVDSLWSDYTSTMFDQSVPDHIKHPSILSRRNEYPYNSREIPRVVKLICRLPWPSSPQHA